MHAPTSFTAVAVVAVVLALAPSAAAGVRTWTNADGRSIQAELVSVEGGNAVFLAGGRRSTVPLGELSEADRTYIADKWSPPFDYGIFRPGSKPWPAATDLHPRATEIEIVAADPDKRHFVYRTNNFVFHSDAELAGSTMKDVSQSFEATYLLLQSLPWSVPARGEDSALFPAALFERFEDYVRQGGPPNSGGVYKPLEKRFLVPFSSLGLEKKNDRYFRSEHYDVETLVHEVTHMMMGRQLDYLPIWIIEGSAEFTANMPYSGGRFRCDDSGQGLRRYLDKYGKGRGGRRFSRKDLRGVLEISTEDWHARANASSSEQHRLYAASFVLFYYFEHLDGRGDGRGIHEFLHRVSGEARRWDPYWVAIGKYREAMEEFKALPAVETTPDGQVHYPAHLTPPRSPDPPEPGGYSESVRYLHRDLLFRGRSEMEILQDLVEKLDQSLRIRL